MNGPSFVGLFAIGYIMLIGVVAVVSLRSDEGNITKRIFAGWKSLCSLAAGIYAARKTAKWRM
jgi:hypothetical protein